MRYVTSVERLSRQEGRREGLAEGIRQGEAALLERLLRRRFAELPRWVSERLDKATHDELARWSERLLDARRLDDVFAIPSLRGE